MKTAAGNKAYRAAIMTPDKGLQFQIHLSEGETEATTWSLAYSERVTSQMETDIYGINSNNQKWFKQEFSIRLIEFEAWRETIRIQALWKTIEQCVIRFGYPKMHLVSHISESIGRMGSGDNFTTHMSEQLHIANMKEAHRTSSKVNYCQGDAVLKVCIIMQGPRNYIPPKHISS